MDDSLIIVTSFHLPDDATSLPEAIVTAFESHARSGIVTELHVLTESDEQLVKRLTSGICGGKKMEVVKTRMRPTFADLCGYASNRIAETGGTAAILTSDVSFGSDEDIRRCRDSLAGLSKSVQAPVVYALTRHEAVQSGWKITLFEECGLPNMLSTDCWFILSPVLLEPADSYPLGQVNCDLMANYDLVNAGCSIFNPCLDVCIQRHGTPPETNEFNIEASRKTDILGQLKGLMTSRGNPSHEYYGVPRVASDWLTSGYRPAPYSSKSKKLFVRVRVGEDPGLPVGLMEVEEFAVRNSLDLVILAEGSLDDLFWKCMPIIARNDRVYLMELDCPFESFAGALLAEGYDGLRSIAFASSIRLLSDQLATVSDFIILDLGVASGENPDTRRNRLDVIPGRYPFVERTSFPDRRAGGGCRCTLVSSVFRSDEFLWKFLCNIKELDNYHSEIDHIFLVSETSAEERRILVRHLVESRNALIVWNRVDPGLYACWNIGIGLAQTEFVSNANVDDLRAPDHVSKLVRILEDRPHVGVVSSALVPFEEHTGFLVEAEPSRVWYSDQGGDFGYNDLGKAVEEAGSGLRLKPHNLPHCMPVWRRGLHDRFGFFDEERYGTYADWAFWLKVTKSGVVGYLHPEPLSYYYVNPGSHNRRGDKLEAFHRRIEEEFLESFVALKTGNSVKGSTVPVGSPGVRVTPTVERKLNLAMSGLTFGVHRNSFNSLIESLRPLHLGAGGILFLPFIERYFVWGDRSGEALSKNPKPLDQEWIGILHVPFDSPGWFAKKQRPEVFFESELWMQSLPSCRGIVCLCKDLESDLKACYPGLPTLALKHPTELKTRRFDFDAYDRNPRLVQIGDWLRQLRAIYRVKASGHKKMMLAKPSTKGHIDQEIRKFGKFVNKSVVVKEFVSNSAYDEILASSVVLCLLYASAANNLVLECIVRGTPIIINPLPSVVEYLGEEYPLYATTFAMVDELLLDRERILEASMYLRKRRSEVDFSYEGFCKTFAGSSFYEEL